jgi:pimeloyl-ACP methyl ester carboxylesterase
MRTGSKTHPFRSAEARDRYLTYYDSRARQWPVPAQNLIVETSQGQTQVRISGPADAPPLVLLPGMNASSLMWRPNVAELSQRYRVHAVDIMSDFGRSVAKRRMRTGSDLANWLDELFTAMSLGDGINLMGISYGGWIASQYALRHSGRLRKLVLLAPGRTVLQVRPAFILRAVPCIIPLRWFTRRFIHWLFADAAANPEVSVHVDAMIDHAYLGLRSFKLRRPVLPTILTDEELRTLAVATLFMVGENEKLYSASDAVERLGRVAPGISTELVANAGHDLTIARAAHVNEKVLAFLEAGRQDGSGETRSAAARDGVH